MTTPAIFLEEECFNVHWKIKNFSYCCTSIQSTEFTCSRYTYCLVLTPGFANVECRFAKIRPEDRFCCNETLAIEIAFLTCDGSPEESISGEKTTRLQVPKDVIFGNRRNAFLPDDTLTVRFRCSTAPQKAKLFICSQIGMTRKYFVWTFKYQSDNASGFVITAENSTLYGHIQLKLKSVGGMNCDEQFSIEISRANGERCFCVLAISVLDVDGKALNEVRDEFILEMPVLNVPQTRGFPSIIKKSKWIGHKNLLLSDGMLSLKCYLAVSSGTVSDRNTVIYYCENSTSLVKESGNLMEAFIEKKNSISGAELQADLKRFLDNGTLFDASLQIGSETIRAHKSILSARSSVFRAMFTKDMKEKNSNTVVIEDFDVETMRGLLVYMYTDSIDDDNWEYMRRLYYVADKYEVLSLKAKCVSYLKNNLSISNVCDALALVDLHQDADLKTAAIDIISENDSAVFASEAWKELEKNRSSIACQVLREICCNKRFG